MRAFTEPIKKLKEFSEITAAIGKKGMVQVAGCIDAQKPHFIYTAGADFPYKVVLTYSETRAKELYENYRFFNKKVLLYPARDLIFYSADIHSNLIVQQRIAVLKALAEEEEVTVITTMGGCMDHLLPLDEIKRHILHLENDSTIEVEAMKRSLVAMGYERVSQVEGMGQFAVRGGIIDIFPLTEENPVRIELWGDEVDSIRSFDAESQRSIENLDFLPIYPANEVIADREHIEAAIEKIENDVKKPGDAHHKDAEGHTGPLKARAPYKHE